MTNEERETFEAARTKWGDVSQLDMCQEECAELIVSLAHVKRDAHASSTDRWGQRMAVLDEIVDVSIVLDEMQCVFGITPEEFEQARAYKIRRLRQRLGLEKS